MQRYLVQAVETVWKAHQYALFDLTRRQNEAVVVGGDARCCSPGHSAKYGSYSLMDLELGQILDVQLIKVKQNAAWKALLVAQLIKKIHWSKTLYLLY